jgi:hypothetical protein
LAQRFVLEARSRKVEAGDQRVDASEAFDGGIDEMQAGGGFREVAGHSQYLRAGSLHLASGVAQGALLAGGHDDKSALVCQSERGRLADPTRGAGDDRYFTAETEVHPSPFAQRALS